MSTTEDEVTSLDEDILIPLGIIYTKFISDGRGPSGQGSGRRTPANQPQERRVYSAIPLRFGAIMGHQFGIFLGDLASEQHIYGQYNTDQPTVVINVEEVNRTIPEIDRNGVALLLAHELGHAYRWYMGHVGGNDGYTNEIWARTLELAYVEGIRTPFHAKMLDVSFLSTAAFIKKHRKSLYKLSAGERQFYSSLTGDQTWESSKTNTASQCPKGDPTCFRPPNIAMLHVACKPPT